MKNLFKKEETMEILKRGEFGSNKFRKAVQKAYSDFKIEKYQKGKNVVFEQGSGRVALVPVDIVEDIIGTKVELFSRAA